MHLERASVTTIKLNGQEHPLTSVRTLTDLVAQVTGRRISAHGQSEDGRRLGVAVARNAEVVPRSQWFATVLAEGDDIEIVTAVQGG